MKRALIAVLVALAPIAAPAADVAQQKKEMQEDACWAWERAFSAGGRYHQKADNSALAWAMYALEEQGFTKYDYTLDRDPAADRWQQVCDRYFDRFEEWPEKCCGSARLLYGTASPEAKEQGRKDRKARLDRLLKDAKPLPQP